MAPDWCSPRRRAGSSAVRTAGPMRPPVSSVRARRNRKIRGLDEDQPLRIHAEALRPNQGSSSSWRGLHSRHLQQYHDFISSSIDYAGTLKDFGGKRSIELSTTTILGGQHYFLASALVLGATMLLLFAVAYKCCVDPEDVLGLGRAHSDGPAPRT